MNFSCSYIYIFSCILLATNECFQFSVNLQTIILSVHHEKSLAQNNICWRMANSWNKILFFTNFLINCLFVEPTETIFRICVAEIKRKEKKRVSKLSEKVRQLRESLYRFRYCLPFPLNFKILASSCLLHNYSMAQMPIMPNT